MVIITILVTLVLFGILIVIHEFGHFMVAKAFKVGIIEFSVGMGPKIHTWEGENNDFSIRALPIGGYVRMVGEPGEEDPKDLPKIIGKTSLNDVNVFKRMLIVLAGPIMNILLAFVLMLILVASSEAIPSTQIAHFLDSNVSSSYGLQEEDTIVQVNGKTIHCYADLSYAILTDGAEPVDILVNRNGELILLEDVCFGTTVESGITMGAVDFSVWAKEKTIGTVFYEAFWEGCNSVYITVDSLIDTFAGKYGIEAVGGPVAVGEEVGTVISSSSSFANTLRNLGTLAALLSVSLGICNLIPLPALDGGRFVIYVIEAIRRKPLPKKVENAMTAGCMIVLFILMALIFVKDFIGIF